MLVRLGLYGYNVQLRITKAQPEAIDPDVDAFCMGLNLLGKSSRNYEPAHDYSYLGYTRHLEKPKQTGVEQAHQALPTLSRDKARATQRIERETITESKVPAPLM